MPRILRRNTSCSRQDTASARAISNPQRGGPQAELQRAVRPIDQGQSTALEPPQPCRVSDIERASVPTCDALFRSDPEQLKFGLF